MWISPLIVKPDHSRQQQEWYDVGEALGYLSKSAATPRLSYSLKGRLYVSDSGWGLLSVPNAIVRGLFDAIHEIGTELPKDENGRLNAHVSIFSKEDIEAIGGPEKLDEKGHSFSYTLGPIKTVVPTNWGGISRCWYCTIISKELKALRKSYGLPALPHNGEYDFHITFAVKKVVKRDETNKAAGSDPTYNAVRDFAQFTPEAAEEPLPHLDNTDKLPEVETPEEPDLSIPPSSHASHYCGKEAYDHFEAECGLEEQCRDKLASLRTEWFYRFSKEADSKNPTHWAILGASGSGKTTLAHKLALKLGLPVYSLDHDRLWRKTDLKDNPDRFKPGTKTNEKWTKLRKKIIDYALALPEAHVLEGCQFGASPGKLKGHKIVLLDPTKKEVIRRRLQRDNAQGKLERDGVKARRAKALEIFKGQQPELDFIRTLPDVERVTDVDKFVEKQKTHGQEEHQKSVGIDIDGTLTEHGDWKGEDNFHPLRPGAVDGVKRLKSEGYKVIIWTCRGNTKKIEEWLKKNDIPYDEINHQSEQPKGTSKKLMVDYFIDDRNIDGTKSWSKIVDDVLNKTEKKSSYDGVTVTICPDGELELSCGQ